MSHFSFTSLATCRSFCENRSHIYWITSYNLYLCCLLHLTHAHSKCKPALLYILRSVAKEAVTSISPLTNKTPTQQLPAATSNTPTQPPPEAANNDPTQQLPAATNTPTQELSATASNAPLQELPGTSTAEPSPNMDVNQGHIGLLTTAPSRLMPGNIVARTARPMQALHINTAMPPPPPQVASWQAHQTSEAPDPTSTVNAKKQHTATSTPQTSSHSFYNRWHFSELTIS